MPRNFSACPVKATLSETLDHRLKMYSLAAAAAGVSVLALAQPADAEVVITQVNVHLNTFGSVSIDINHDGIPDFKFSFFETEFAGSILNVAPMTGGAVFLCPKPLGYYAAALQRLARIGPLGHFSTKGGGVTIERDELFTRYIGSGAFYTYSSLHGNWGNVLNRYLGVKFLIDGETHYGWIRLSVTTILGSKRIPSEILAYSYETIPNQPIVARIPQDPSEDAESQEIDQSVGRASLGMLALGADGLSLWRRDETLSF